MKIKSEVTSLSLSLHFCIRVRFAHTQNRNSVHCDCNNNFSGAQSDMPTEVQKFMSQQ